MFLVTVKGQLGFMVDQSSIPYSPLLELKDGLVKKAKQKKGKVWLTVVLESL